MKPEAQQSPKRPRISDFEDYRDFLNEMFHYRKALNPRFSYQTCAKALDTTQSYLKLVTTKRRHISLERLLPLCSLFKLSPREKSSLIFMALTAVTKDKNLSQYFKTIFRRHSWSVGTPSEKLTDQADDKVHFSMASMLHGTITALSSLPDFRATPEWIWRKLGGDPVRIEDVAATLEHLIASGVLTKNGDGRWTDQVEASAIMVDATKEDPYQNVKEGLLYLHQAFDDVQHHAPMGHRALFLPVTDQDFKFIRDKLAETSAELWERGFATKEPTDVAYVSLIYANVTPGKLKKP